jgi:hypothetical protein
MDLKLWLGIGIHIALARRYGPGQRRRRDFIDKFREYCADDSLSQAIRLKAEGDSLMAAKWTSALELGEAMLTGYREKYGRDRNWDVIYTEEQFQIEIPDPRSRSRRDTLGRFASTFDGVYRDRSDGLIKLMEHKTAAQIRTNHLNNDDQAGAYWAFATAVLQDKGVLGPRERIAGITYNFLRKALPDTDRERNAEGLYLNKNGSISKQQPAPLFARHFVERTRAERANQVRRIANEMIIMEQFRAGNLPIIKNNTMDCYWDCEFYTMCTLHEQGAEWREFREAQFIRVDPHANYRPSTEE